MSRSRLRSRAFLLALATFLPALAGAPELNVDLGRFDSGGGGDPESERAADRAVDGTGRRGEELLAGAGREREGAAEDEAEGRDDELAAAGLDDDADASLDVDADGCLADDEGPADAFGGAGDLASLTSGLSPRGAVVGRSGVSATAFFANDSVSRGGFLSSVPMSTSRERSSRSRSRARRFSCRSRSISSIVRMSRLSLLSARRPSSAKRLLISALPWLAPRERDSASAADLADDEDELARLRTDDVGALSPKIDLFSLILRSSARVSSSLAGRAPGLRPNSAGFCEAGRE